jgi:hypothetical protein
VHHNDPQANLKLIRDVESTTLQQQNKIKLIRFTSDLHKRKGSN